MQNLVNNVAKHNICVIKPLIYVLQTLDILLFPYHCIIGG